MPIGRRTYFHLEQISFFEFVIETGNEALFKKMSSFSLESRMPESLHQFMAEKRLNFAVRFNINQKEPTVDTLQSIQHSQLFTIPFENFDIQFRRSINLHLDALFKKLVLNKRGGYL